ncbi:hypothetical protein Tco_1164146 [Tanacetum coccineum]
MSGSRSEQESAFFNSLNRKLCVKHQSSGITKKETVKAECLKPSGSYCNNRKFPMWKWERKQRILYKLTQNLTMDMMPSGSHCRSSLPSQQDSFLFERLIVMESTLTRLYIKCTIQSLDMYRVANSLSFSDRDAVIFTSRSRQSSAKCFRDSIRMTEDVAWAGCVMVACSGVDESGFGGETREKGNLRLEELWTDLEVGVDAERLFTSLALLVVVYRLLGWWLPLCLGVKGAYMNESEVNVEGGIHLAFLDGTGGGKRGGMKALGEAISDRVGTVLECSGVSEMAGVGWLQLVASPVHQCVILEVTVHELVMLFPSLGKGVGKGCRSRLKLASELHCSRFATCLYRCRCDFPFPVKGVLDVSSCVNCLNRVKGVEKYRGSVLNSADTPSSVLLRLTTMIRKHLIVQNSKTLTSSAPHVMFRIYLSSSSPDQFVSWIKSYALILTF